VLSFGRLDNMVDFGTVVDFGDFGTVGEGFGFPQRVSSFHLATWLYTYPGQACWLQSRMPYQKFIELQRHEVESVGQLIVLSLP
jgi:hypothetical protein